MNDNVILKTKQLSFINVTSWKEQKRIQEEIHPRAESEHKDYTSL